MNEKQLGIYLYLPWVGLSGLLSDSHAHGLHRARAFR